MPVRAKPYGEHEGFFSSQQSEIRFWWESNSVPAESTTLPGRASHLNHPAFRILLQNKAMDVVGLWLAPAVWDLGVGSTELLFLEQAASIILSSNKHAS